MYCIHANQLSQLHLHPLPPVRHSHHPILPHPDRPRQDWLSLLPHLHSADLGRRVHGGRAHRLADDRRSLGAQRLLPLRCLPLPRRRHHPEKAVPYTVTNFADKKLSIDTISHYTVQGTHTFRVESMHPAKITVLQVGVDGYEANETCWFPVSNKFCLICNHKAYLYSLYGTCTLLGPGTTILPKIRAHYNQVYSWCTTNVKYCYYGSVLLCYDKFYPNPTRTTCLACDHNCYNCTGTSTNCTSCLAGSSLTQSMLYENEATCTVCPLHCTLCDDWTRICTQCGSDLH